MALRKNVLKGGLEMLVLSVLASPDESTGTKAAQRIRWWSDLFAISDGSLYPTLQKLEAEGLVASRATRSRLNRKAQNYSLTEAGFNRLRAEQVQWDELVKAVERVMCRGHKTRR